jgi:hypothetical protein
LEISKKIVTVIGFWVGNKISKVAAKTFKTLPKKGGEFFLEKHQGKKMIDFLNIRYAVRKSYPINRVRFPNGVTNV